MTDFDRAMDLLLEHEGGWSNHPADRGGATMYGVTQATYDDWRRRRGRPAQSVRNITKAEAGELYKRLYWDAVRGDELPWPTNYLLFDGAVHAGPKRSIQMAQRAVLATADGILGPKTLDALRRAGPRQRLAYVKQRALHLAAIMRANPSQRVFAGGWLRRMVDLAETAALG